MSNRRFTEADLLKLQEQGKIRTINLHSGKSKETPPSTLVTPPAPVTRAIITEGGFSLFVPGIVRSSKNSKQILSGGPAQVKLTAEKVSASQYRQAKQKAEDKSGKPKLYISKAAATYRKEVLPYFEQYSEAARSVYDRALFKPVQVAFKFIRPTKHPFDFNNLSQILCDLMVETKWMPDDNFNYVTPVFLTVAIDKENPGVIITF